MNWIRLGIILGLTGVFLGTFGAHGLPEYLEHKIPLTDMRKISGIDVPYRLNYLEVFNTGVKYQFYHAIALLFLGLYSFRRQHKLINIIGNCFFWGTLLFSGSIYLLVVTYIKPLAMITPIGGILFIIGWICLLVLAYIPEEKTTITPE